MGIYFDEETLEFKVRLDVAESRYKEDGQQTIITYIKYQKCKHDDIIELIRKHAGHISEQHIRNIIDTRMSDDKTYIVLKYKNNDLESYPILVGVLDWADFNKLYKKRCVVEESFKEIESDYPAVIDTYIDTDVKITNELLESVTKQKEIINNQFGKLAADAMFGKDEKPELGMKHDQEKPMMNLIPPSVFESLGKVLTYGANKYAPNSWQHVSNAEERYKAALLRHFVEYMKNPLSKDEESGMYHIEHVLCNAAFLNDFAMNKCEELDYDTDI